MIKNLHCRSCSSSLCSWQAEPRYSPLEMLTEEMLTGPLQLIVPGDIFRSERSFYLFIDVCFLKFLKKQYYYMIRAQYGKSSFILSKIPKTVN